MMYYNGVVAIIADLGRGCNPEEVCKSEDDFDRNSCNAEGNGGCPKVIDWN